MHARHDADVTCSGKFATKWCTTLCNFKLTNFKPIVRNRYTDEKRTFLKELST